MRYLLIALLLLQLLPAAAQTRTDFLKAADKYFEQGDFFSAASYYEKYLDENAPVKPAVNNPFAVTRQQAVQAQLPASAKRKAVYQLAESYRKLNHFVKAAPHYASLAQGDQQANPDLLYWYATCLAATNRTAEANDVMQRYVAANAGDKELLVQAKQQVKNYAFASQQMQRADTALYKVSKAAINSTGATYAPVISKGDIYFTSTRNDSTTTGPYTNHIYSASYSQNSFGMPTRLAVPGGIQEQGAAAFAPSGKMYFTRWQSTGAKGAAIYTSEPAAGGWSEPVKLPLVNTDGYNAQHPFVTNDCKFLLFASDMPGTMGKLDLWVAPLDADGNVAAAPKNLGSTINTAGDDVSPFYHAASNTLVFASNGRVGLGGFDLFTSAGDFNIWAQPVNAGYPVNSVKDDLHFFTNSNERLFTSAFISSDRYSACCLELLTLDREYKRYMTGLVVDCKTQQPLAGTQLTIEDGSGRNIRITTSADGRYLHELPAQYAAGKVTGEKDNYHTATITTAGGVFDTMQSPLLCLQPIDKPQPPSKLMFVYFDFDVATLRDEAKSTLDSLAAAMTKVPGMKIEIGGYTDGKGNETYNMRLSENRAKACMKYLVETKMIDASRIVIMPYGECCHVGNETTSDGKDNPEGRQLNRRAEFKIIGF
ncbi:OmpA family protein [Aridibaculum aurantiacum]|uniref:OmpA family protein n=1 Tax=Aridibaculum aurantiacum TaxID=2810307 RepID=UPI001A964476|nr:OmpA family protein [Aridibaculum aurantiacum]